MTGRLLSVVVPVLVPVPVQLSAEVAALFVGQEQRLGGDGARQLVAALPKQRLHQEGRRGRGGHQLGQVEGPQGPEQPRGPVQRYRGAEVSAPQKTG